MEPKWNSYRKKVGTLPLALLATVLSVGCIWRPPRSGIITTSRMFDFDDFGTAFNENLFLSK